MGFLSTLLIKIGADTRELGTGLDKATRDVRRFGADLTAAGTALTAGISIPLGGVAVAALKAQGAMEQTQVAFTTLLKSADAAKVHLEDLKKFALTTPFQFEDLTKASRLMQAYGFAAADVVPKLRTIGNAVSALGGGSDVLERVVRSLGEIGTRGKVTGEQLRELSRAGIPALDAIAKKLGVTVAEAQRMVTAGAVDAQTALDALLGYMDERFKGGMEAQSRTMLGTLSNLKDKLTFTLSDIGASLAPWAREFMTGTIEPLLSKLQEVAHGFANLPKPVQDASIAIGGLAVGVPVATVALGMLITNGITVAAAIGKVGALVGPLATSFGGTLATALGTASTAYAAFAGSLTVVGILAAGKAVYDLTVATLDLIDARKLAAKSAQDQDAQLERLRQHLMAVQPAGGMKGWTEQLNLWKQQYDQGLLKFGDYLRNMQRLAVEHGKGTIDALGNVHSSIIDTTKILERFGVDSTAARQKAYDQAKKDYADLVKAGTESAVVLQAAKEKVNAARDALYGVADSAKTAKEALVTIPWQEKSLQGKVLADYIGLLSKNFDETAMAAAKFRLAMEKGFDLPPSIAGVFRGVPDDLHNIVLGANDATTAEQKAAKAYYDFSNLTTSTAAKNSVAWWKSIYAPAVKSAAKEMNELEREARRAFDGMARSMARSIVDWKGWADGIKDVGKNLATSFLEIMMRQLFKPLENQFAKLAGWIGGILGGGGSSAAGSAAGSVASAGGSAAGGAISGGSGVASTVGGVTSSGLASTVGMITGAVSAVSGVVGNFQFAGMNKTLDLIEHETRYTHGILQSMMDLHNLHLPKLESIWGYLWEVQTEYLNKITWGIEQMSGTGGGKPQTINVYLDSKLIWSGLASQAQLAGVR